MMGKILNIQRFCTDDGPGIRTTVFFKGCPLRCVWCHNPESQRSEQESMFYADRCVGCGRCRDAGYEEEFKCYHDARITKGKEVSSDEVVAELLKDKPFYDRSGGGITLSGGEPLFQPDFALDILKIAKKQGLHTAIETCGFAPSDNLIRILPYVDLFLFDVKETDSALHERFTGLDNSLILQNLRIIDDAGKKTVLRCPIIEGYNDREEHLTGIRELSSTLKHLTLIEIEPYHSLGESKYRALGREPISADAPTPERIEEIVRFIQDGTDVSVKRA